VRLLPWRHGFVAIVDDGTAQRLADRALVRRMQQAIDGIDGLPAALGLRIGVGRLVARAGEIGDALAGAEQALAAATRLPAHGAVVRFEDLGIYRLLLGGNAATDHAEFARQVLAPLAAIDTRGQLFASLEALTRHDFNCAAAARALRIHVNTMKYRMQQLRDAFGRDPARGELRLEIELALKIRALG
jgi:purine catabolism regulator